MLASSLTRRTALAAAFACLAFGSIGSATAQSSAAAGEKVIFQVSDNDPGKWNLTLNNAKNVQDGLGKDKVNVEIVVYGPGIHMLKMESPVGNRVNAAVQAGVNIVACENTMQNMKLGRNDMLQSISYVPGGVIELMQRQKEGWAYIKP